MASISFSVPTDLQIAGNLTVNSLGGLLKGTAGLVSVATAGTDYATPAQLNATGAALSSSISSLSGFDLAMSGSLAAQIAATVGVLSLNGATGLLTLTAAPANANYVKVTTSGTTVMVSGDTTPLLSGIALPGGAQVSGNGSVYLNTGVTLQGGTTTSANGITWAGGPNLYPITPILLRTDASFQAGGNISASSLYNGPNGTAAAPPFTFAAYQGAGVYYPGNSGLGLSAGGAVALGFDVSQVAHFSSGLFFRDTGNYTPSGAASVAQLLAQSGFDASALTTLSGWLTNAGTSNVVYTTGDQTIGGFKQFSSSGRYAAKLSVSNPLSTTSITDVVSGASLFVMPGGGTLGLAVALDTVANRPLIQSVSNGAAFSMLLNPYGGNVGIGDSNPSQKLGVSGNIRAAGGDFLIATANHGIIDQGSAASVIFDGNGRITATAQNSLPIVLLGGNVGIGLTNPTSTLVVSGTSLFTNVMVLGSGLVMPSGATTTGAGISWNDLNLFRSTGNVLALNGTAPTLAFQDAGTQRAFIQTVNQSLNVAAQNGLTFQTNANVTAQSLSISGDALFARNVSAASGLFFADTGNYTRSGAASVAQLMGLSGAGSITYATIANLAQTGATIETQLNNLSGWLTNASSSNIVYTTGTQTISGGKFFLGAEGLKSIDTSGRKLLDDAESLTLDWKLTTLTAADQLSLDWTNRILCNSAGSTTVSYDGNNLGLFLADSNGHTSIDWDARGLSDTGNHLVLTWNASGVTSSSGIYLRHTGNYARNSVASVAQLFALSGAVTTNVVMTNNTTATATFNSGVSDETIYDDSVSLVSSLTINLPSVSRSGQLLRYLSKAGGTIVTVNGNVSVGAAITTLAANSSVAWQSTNTTGTFIRLQ